MRAPLLTDRKRLLLWLAWLLIYFVAGKLGLRFATVNASSTPFWPPTGIALSFLLLEGYAFWPVILIGAFLVNITTTGGPLSSVGIAAGNALEALAAAWLVNRFAEGSRFFSKPITVFTFTLATSAGALVSASIGVTVLCLGRLADWSHYGSIWTTWWLGDVTGAIIFAPFILVWLSRPEEERVSRKPIETVLFVLTCVAAEEIVFGSHSVFSSANYPIVFLWIPVMVWAGFRFGLRGTTAMTTLLCPVAIWQTLHGLGPFVQGGPNASLLIAQTFTAVMVTTSVGIAAIVRERTQMEQSLRTAQMSAERQVEQRTAALAASNTTLREAQRNLQRLSAKLMRAQDEERRHVARELHDSSGQLLAALSMELSKLRDETEKLSSPGVKALSDAVDLVDEIAKDIRTLSYLLHPPLLDECGLIPAVRWYAEGFAQRSGVHVDLNLDEDVGRLASGAETAAFRIVQECLTNIHRHSGSAAAGIDIRREANGALKIQVSDKGRGIPTEVQTRVGVGISGMRERLHTLGGELQIYSGKTGTTVTATVPAAVPNEERAQGAAP